MFLYLTADAVGTQTGGGLVTAQELRALQELGDVQVVSRKELKECYDRNPVIFEEPWKWDSLAYYNFGDRIKLAHIYSGTFTQSVWKLKANGARVVYTIAAHSIETSRREHEKLGIPYAQLYPHLCEPVLWKRYSGGYFAADHIVCPSTYSKRTVEKQAADLGIRCPPVAVIPHGCDLPDAVKPLPKRFTVGYMGAYGADKGVLYLIAAWKKLAYPDATLILAGRDSTSDYIKQLVQGMPGGGNIELRGWVENVSDFYSSLSLYVQPSATEGFGCEVLEAMSHGLPVICSEGAGANCIIKDTEGEEDVRHCECVKACDVDALAESINWQKKYPLDENRSCIRDEIRERAALFTWDKIRQRYIKIWQEVLNGSDF